MSYQLPTRPLAAVSPVAMKASPGCGCCCGCGCGGGGGVTSDKTVVVVARVEDLLPRIRIRTSARLDGRDEPWPASPKRIGDGRSFTEREVPFPRGG